MSFGAVTESFSRVLLETATSILPRWSTPAAGTALPQKLLELLERNQREKSSPQADYFTNNGILLAVPKKKVSHQKKRQKLYAPGDKQLKMINHLNKCPSCGHYKKAHTLCMHCVGEIRHIWKAHTNVEQVEPIQEQELSELDKRILYPGRKETEYTKKLKDKDAYLERRMKTLPVERSEKKEGSH
ncbi:mitochondrial 54S ribosomal protein bL32m [Kluyveromyces lactis]|uniref:Large ribosomal subunit protein bL32m n=1 Tax=Kluyveromyces lactis (strain ATCC 8585 / CBS 2359 / DSM 70799 / NBRC 1267 / NRRL Y-1140 / WM37) TaxID=284590 RepID=Q6CK81_KLULA|nr:mitochondrial 54S ribosomal protein YmL32 [Kluyveromyces lactis]CAG98366.1 KLLA0F12826p [Kluyveromyces lactis]|eukprot:XP_455658.1 mitochondrial 54S ribosomal protein YmL32 [Kluyveromyces lactis]